MNMFNRIENNVFIVSSGISILAFLTILFLILINIFGRFFDVYSISWIGEIIEITFSWMVFIGAAALWIKHEHFRVDYLNKKLVNTKIGSVLEFSVLMSCLFFLVIMTWQGAMLTLKSSAETPILEIPTSISYASIPLSGFIMSIYCMRDLYLLLISSKSAPIKPVIDNI